MKRKKKKLPLRTLIENYLATLFIMWVTAAAIGSDIIGYFHIFLAYMIASIFFYILHLLLYNFLSYKHNRIAKNILFIILPFMVVSFTYILTIVTKKPTLEEFVVVRTTRLPCGETTRSPQKYVNTFMSGKHTSKFILKRNGHTIAWYPNEENYYKYKQGDVIKVKVKKNFLDMEVIVQQNRDED